jgi:hypothetical protein
MKNYFILLIFVLFIISCEKNDDIIINNDPIDGDSVLNIDEFDTLKNILNSWNYQYSIRNGKYIYNNINYDSVFLSDTTLQNYYESIDNYANDLGLFEFNFKEKLKINLISNKHIYFNNINVFRNYLVEDFRYEIIEITDSSLVLRYVNQYDNTITIFYKKNYNEKIFN